MTTKLQLNVKILKIPQNKDIEYNMNPKIPYKVERKCLKQSSISGKNEGK